jgi:ABC-type transport system involved in multi-copper enzyme maturation permease subunit
MIGRSIPILAWRSIVQARHVLLGSVCLLSGFQVVVVGQASAIEEAHSFSRVAELVPAFLQRGLGSRSLLLASFKGTVALGYFHPVVAVLTAVVAVYFATEPAHEVDTGLVDLTLARAVPRHALITRALMLVLVTAFIAVTLMAAGTWLGLRLFASPSFPAPSFATRVLLLGHLAAVAVCFGAVGLFIASGARRWSTAFTTAVLIVIVLYCVDFLAIGWPLMRSLSWVSPFHYYPALDIIAGDPVSVTNPAILVGTTAVFAAGAYWRFIRRDL